MQSTLTTHAIRKIESSQLPNGPSDSVSRLVWSTEDQSPLLAASSWDGTLRIWAARDLNNIVSPSSFPVIEKCMFRSTAPILDTCFAPNSGKIFAAGCDKCVTMYDLGSSSNSQGTVIGKHTAPIRRIRFIPQYSLVASGGWDGVVNLWDGKSPTPAYSANLNSKIFCMDVSDTHLAAITANKALYHLDLRNKQSGKVDIPGAVSLQAREMAFYPPGIEEKGLIIGTADSRISVLSSFFSSELKKARECVLKHHEMNKNDSFIHPINCFTVSPKKPFVMVGTHCGGFNVYDLDARRLSTRFDATKNPVTALAVHPQLQLLAYAEGYDWNMGNDPEYTKKTPVKIFASKFRPHENFFGGRGW